jgi:Flp pilus assembly protein protease CpaA
MKINMKKYFKPPWFLISIPLLIVVLSVAVIIAYSYLTHSKVASTLSILLILEGVIIFILGGLIGAGYSETALLRTTPGYFLASRTAEILQKDRIYRRDQQFVFMIVTCIMGGILMGIGYLVNKFFA